MRHFLLRSYPSCFRPPLLKRVEKYKGTTAHTANQCNTVGKNYNHRLWTKRPSTPAETSAMMNVSIQNAPGFPANGSATFMP